MQSNPRIVVNLPSIVTLAWRLVARAPSFVARVRLGCGPCVGPSSGLQRLLRVGRSRQEVPARGAGDDTTSAGGGGRLGCLPGR